MNARTAQTLLRCFRPGKPADSRTEKAIRFAQDDPELSKLLSEQTAFDQQIIDAIHFIKPPEDLRKKLVELGAKPGAEKTLRAQMINPAVLTAILGVVVILGIAVFFIMDRMEKFTGREQVEDMLQGASKMNGSEMDAGGSTVGQLGDSLVLRGYDGFESPPDLAALPVVASRVFYIDRRGVVQAALDDGENVRCLFFEFYASEFGVELPQDGNWKILTQNEWVAAIRQHGDRCFLVAFKGTKPDMQKFLKSLPSKS